MKNKALTAGLTLDLCYVHMWRNSFSLSQTDPKDDDGALYFFRDFIFKVRLFPSATEGANEVNCATANLFIAPFNYVFTSAVFTFWGGGREKNVPHH